jgi:hypothetical protein
MIPNYIEHGQYIVYPDGRVFSKMRGIFLVPLLGKGRSQYYSIKVPKRISVHRLVAMLYIPNPDNLPEVNHKDGDKLNNNYWNLEWCTRLHNMEHAYRTGLKDNSGEKSGTSKLKSIHVRIIREAIATKRFTHTEIAQYFKIDQSTISNIKSGKSWASL